MCVEALGDGEAVESEKLDWLLSMGLMWATDLKTGLKGSTAALLVWAIYHCRACCVLYAACDDASWTLCRGYNMMYKDGT